MGKEIEWSDEEDATLRSMVAAGMLRGQISRKLGRTEYRVKARAKVLGVKITTLRAWRLRRDIPANG